MDEKISSVAKGNTSVDKNGLLPENYDSLDTGVLSGGWAKVDEKTIRFIVESVNGLNPNPEGFSLPWQTRACFSEIAGEACWCFEIHDKDGKVIVPYGEINKEDAKLVVESVNKLLANWPEDFHLENGNYICHCVFCDKFFIGYKRRVICRKCTFNTKDQIDESSCF